jgi:predicted nucleotidyltransferase component of viral defense system
MERALMLTRADLIRLARQKGIGLGRLEHEYVILCLLDTLASAPLGNRLAFKGGTALRQVYFPDWRYSDGILG